MNKPCLEPGCNNTGPGTRCPTHTKPRNTAKNRRRAALTGPNYRRLRRTIRQQGGGTCTQCGQWTPSPNLEIDHITPISQGGTDHPANLRPVCTKCHRAKQQGPPQQPGA